MTGFFIFVSRNAEGPGNPSNFGIKNIIHSIRVGLEAKIPATIKGIPNAS